MFKNLDPNSLSKEDAETFLWFMNIRELQRAALMADAIERVAESTGLGQAKIQSVLLNSEPSGEIKNLDRHLLDALHRLRRQHG
jgi:hypothetical protein